MTTYHKNSPETIRSLFGNIAKDYDRANNVLSLSMHKRWNAALAAAVSENLSVNTFLDLCCGTGEIAFTFLKKAVHPVEVYMLDFCDEMLQCAKQKASQNQFDTQRLHYIRSDAQNIPLQNDSVDCVTIAYGVRNVCNPYKCLEEAHRVLRPGGKIGILELTEPHNWLMRQGHRIYLKTVLPFLGKMIASDKAAYQYLCDSIHAFISPKQLLQLMEHAGFIECQINPLCGGIASLFIAEKRNHLR